MRLHHSLRHGRAVPMAPLPDPLGGCPDPSMHVSYVSPALALDPKYWRALCPDLHVCDDAFIDGIKPMVVGGGLAQDAKDRIKELGFTKIPKQVLNWKTVQHRKLASAVITLMQHGWNPSWVLVYDEAWAIVQELSQLIFECTGNLVNHDALAWHVSPRDENPSAFSPHRDRQPDDAPSSFRNDGTAMYATAWVPLTDATPENSCLNFIPRTQDPGYFDGDCDDPNVPAEQSDPLRLSLKNKQAYQHITCVPAEAGSVIIFTHRVIHWGSAPPPAMPKSFVNSGTCEPRVCVSFGFADAEYEPPYLKSVASKQSKDTDFPSLKKRIALVAAQMVSYHERFPSDKKTLKKFHQLFTHADDMFSKEYKRKVLVEYVRAAGEIRSGVCKGGDETNKKKKKERNDDDDGSDDDEKSDSQSSDASDADSGSDAMDAALDAMLDAEIAGDGSDFEDDFDTLAAEDSEYEQEEEAVVGSGKRGEKRKR